MIQIYEKKFALHTRSTSYCFEITDTGHAVHLYYGNRVVFSKDLPEFEMLRQKREFPVGNAVSYDKDHPALVMEDVSLEVSGPGKGDLRSPFAEVVFADSSRTLDWVYDSHIVTKGAKPRKTLPGSYDIMTFEQGEGLLKKRTDEEVADALRVSFVDKSFKIRLDVTYLVYEDTDIITRYADLYNEGEEDVTVKRLLSMQLDLSGTDFEGIYFDGAWAREMHSYHVPLGHGMHVSRSNTGTSSNRANPFFMVAKSDCNEDRGECYGFNLIYSGNHMEIADANSYGKVRIQSGINDEGFEYVLKPGECLEAPESVMTYTCKGFNELSYNMHSFVRQHIVRGEWKGKDRPVLLNSWEAAYFKFDESRLLKLAKRASDAGIELFVMDDGWFGERDDDTKSLGDWEVNKKKLPHGIKGLAERVNSLGMMFGIWVEPEMVNVNSRLYEEHPDWCLANPKRDHSEGRNQRMLDLCRKEVRDYIVEAMSNVFSSGNVQYVKWDMNRVLSDVYSQSETVPSGEVAHRYVLGLYEIMGELTKRFPHILFEGCASGGNRFDLGILCYFPQIWASDNTDALCRAEIQEGYSYGYPPETMGAHVSASPNHQTLRRTPMKTRFAVAAFGSLGYECNLSDFTKEQMDEVKDEIALYKKYRGVLQHGRFYRGGAGPLGDIRGSRESVLSEASNSGNITSWTTVSEYKTAAVGMMLKKLVLPNTQNVTFYPKGLEEETKYRFTNHELSYDIRDFGDLVNTVAPIHVKQDSLLMDLLAKKVKLPSEKEEYTAYGSLLMNAGVALKQNFSGTGYNENVRYDQDFSGKLFFLEEDDGTLPVSDEAVEAVVREVEEKGAEEAETTEEEETKTIAPATVSEETETVTETEVASENTKNTEENV